MQIPSQEHQNLVLALINHFVTQLGYKILAAACGEYEKPLSHGRHAPDILAQDQTGLLHIAEAKVGDDIDSQATGEQFMDFSDRVMLDTAGNLARVPVPFHIIVYKADEQRLMARLNRLGLGTKIGNRIKIWTL